MHSPIVIFGAGPLARLMWFYFSHDSVFAVKAFSVDEQFCNEESLCGVRIIPCERIIREYPPQQVRAFVAVGYRNMRNRVRFYERVKSLGYETVNYVSSRAVVYPDLSLGTNNVVMANVHIEPFVTIGNNNLFWSDTLIAHEVSIGQGNYCGAKVLIGGQSTVGNSCFLGNGTILINSLALADETQTVAGCVLMNNTKAAGRYSGNPARQIGSHEETGIVIQRG